MSVGAFTILKSAAFSADPPPAPGINTDQGVKSTPIQSSKNQRGIKVIIDVTVQSSLALVVTIRGFDPTSGKYFTVLASASLAAVATTVLTVFPGAPVTANVSANDNLPAQWDLRVAHNGGTGTYSIGVEVLA